MRKISILPTICAIIPAAVGLVGCGTSTSRDVTSIRSVPYYEVYNSQGFMTYSGNGTSSHASKRSRYTGMPIAGRPQPGTPNGTPVQPVTARNTAPRKSPSRLLSEAKVRKDYISTRARGRRNSTSMRPRYITIHSTQNWSSGADAWRHSLALKNSKLGRLSWHFTTDENVAVQHLPTNITGNHADFDGPGNRYSIGIEMCEHPGNSRIRTVDRTAKLAAYLMYKYKIPLNNVVPHYHWPRHGMNPAHKNCPHFLLDNGRPGRKWRAFQSKVKKHHDDITKGGAVYVSR